VIPAPSPLPPLSCGSGLSGDYISEEGHYWIGMDISPAMLGEQPLLASPRLRGGPSRGSWQLEPGAVLCRCGRGEGGGRRPSACRCGSWHSLQAWHVWWLYQV